jgi:hypothetical protein
MLVVTGAGSPPSADTRCTGLSIQFGVRTIIPARPQLPPRIGCRKCPRAHHVEGHFLPPATGEIREPLPVGGPERLLCASVPGMARKSGKLRRHTHSRRLAVAPDEREAVRGWRTLGATVDSTSPRCPTSDGRGQQLASNASTDHEIVGHVEPPKSSIPAVAGSCSVRVGQLTDRNFDRRCASCQPTGFC